MTSHPRRVRGVVPEGDEPGDVLLPDVALRRRHLGDGVKIGEADVFHPGLRQPLQALFHAVGEDADDAQHLGPGLPQHVHHLDDAAAGGDEVLHYHHPLARLQPALDLVPAAVVLAAGADVAHGQIQQVAGDGGVGDTGGGGAHEDLNRGILPADGLRQGVLHAAADRRGGEGEAVVAVHGALDAAGPGEGLLRPEEDGLDAEQVPCNLLRNVFHSALLFSCQNPSQSRRAAPRGRRMARRVVTPAAAAAAPENPPRCTRRRPAPAPPGCRSRRARRCRAGPSPGPRPRRGGGLPP